MCTDYYDEKDLWKGPTPSGEELIFLITKKMFSEELKKPDIISEIFTPIKDVYIMPKESELEVYQDDLPKDRPRIKCTRKIGKAVLDSRRLPSG